MTPFGSPVVPEVNGKYITWFASLLAGAWMAVPGHLAERRRCGFGRADAIP
jgi:hypothetical protein